MKDKHHVHSNIASYTHLATIEKPLSQHAEAYRRIKVGIEYSEVDKKIQVIQVSSALQGEGKTTTALNLAVVYAENKAKVCVLDLDFRRPKIHRTFKLVNQNGITDVLAGNITLEEAIKHNDEYPFDIINRGTKSPFPSALLSSKELSAVIAQLRTMYDYIVIDCPPILAVSDAIIISKQTDGCVFVVSQPHTEKSVAKEAMQQLKNNNVNVLGCVLTGITRKNKDYYGYKYNYYYSSYFDEQNQNNNSQAK